MKSPTLFIIKGLVLISLKLDMNKVYDKMEWRFLKAVLTRIGFVDSWIQVIMQCVTTVRYSFLINGQPRGYLTVLTPTRGLRQGDPLSPYLFLLMCAEGFLGLLAHTVSHGFLQGIQVYPEAPSIHHLLFVDDSPLFGLATTEECNHI